MDNNHLENQEVTTEASANWLPTPNHISMLGKLLGIVLAMGAGILSIFTPLAIDLDAINKTAWTLAFLGAPVDASIIFSNIGSAFKKH